MKKSKWFLMAILALAAGIGSMGCGDGSSPSAIPYVPIPTSNTVATPVATLVGGGASTPVASGQTVTLSCATDGVVKIFYTTNGSDPKTSATREVYSGPITIRNDKPTTTIQAIAVKEGWGDSGVLTVNYTITENMSTAPTVTANSREKASKEATWVLFSVFSVPEGIPLNGYLKVYAAATGGEELTTVKASIEDEGTNLKLESLSTDPPLPPGTYYVSLTESSQSESARVALTVREYADKTYTVTPSGSLTTTALIFSFSAPVDDLKVSEVTSDIGITVTNGTGWVKDATQLDGSGTSWILPVTVARAGNISVSINRTDIIGGQAGQSVAVSRESNPIAVVYQNDRYKGTLKKGEIEYSDCSVSADTITGKPAAEGDLIEDVRTSGGGSLSGPGITGSWTYVYQGSTKIGIAYTWSSSSSTLTGICLGKTAASNAKTYLEKSFGVTGITGIDDIDFECTGFLYW